MKISLDQYCVNVSDLEKSVHFYETVLGLEVTYRIDVQNVTGVVLSGEDGNRIQLARHHDQEAPKGLSGPNAKQVGRKVVSKRRTSRRRKSGGFLSDCLPREVLSPPMSLSLNTKGDACV
ncbi:MAG: hypothetical protein CL917_01695 [Deltaproteobacteria bacterium]|nr:hypothetical protein [Deltaproteobacteria bacterium]